MESLSTWCLSIFSSAFCCEVRYYEPNYSRETLTTSWVPHCLKSKKNPKKEMQREKLSSSWKARSTASDDPPRPNPPNRRNNENILTPYLGVVIWCSASVKFVHIRPRINDIWTCSHRSSDSQPSRIECALSQPARRDAEIRAHKLSAERGCTTIIRPITQQPSRLSLFEALSTVSPLFLTNQSIPRGIWYHSLVMTPTNIVAV